MMYKNYQRSDFTSRKLKYSKKQNHKTKALQRLCFSTYVSRSQSYQVPNLNKLPKIGLKNLLYTKVPKQTI